MVREIRDDYYEERKAFFHEMSEKVNSLARNLIENRLAGKISGTQTSQKIQSADHFSIK